MNRQSCSVRSSDINDNVVSALGENNQWIITNKISESMKIDNSCEFCHLEKVKRQNTLQNVTCTQ